MMSVSSAITSDLRVPGEELHVTLAQEPSDELEGAPDFRLHGPVSPSALDPRIFTSIFSSRGDMSQLWSGVCFVVDFGFGLVAVLF